MKRNPKHLSPMESTALHHLGRGLTYKQVISEMEISQAHLHVLCHSIRSKTGILTTKDKAACSAAYAAQGRPLLPEKNLMPSRAQLAVLVPLAHGESYKEIAYALNITAQTAMNHASQGCAAIGMGGYGRQRVPALVEWLKRNGCWVEKNPPAPATTSPADQPDDF